MLQEEQQKSEENWVNEDDKTIKREKWTAGGASVDLAVKKNKKGIEHTATRRAQ
jgi:hypothetical protein